MVRKRKSEKKDDFVDSSPGFDPEKEKQRREQEVQQAKEENEKLLRFEEKQEKLEIQNETKDTLAALREALDRGEKQIDEAQKELEETGKLDEARASEIEEIAESILEKIDALEDLSDYDSYVPEEFQVTKEEYQKAIFQPQFRSKTQDKINHALAHMATFVAESWWGLNLFADSFMFLNKSLIIAQETHIDMKEGLQNVSKIEKTT